MVKGCGNLGLKKGGWSEEEDTILVSYIQKFGHKNWRALPKQAGLLRCGKSCRFRWKNYLRPDIKRGDYSKEEEEIIIRLHNQLGNKWSTMAKSLPGRTDNEIKNYWNTHLKNRTKEKREMTKIKSEPSTTKFEFDACRQLMTLEYPVPSYNQVPSQNFSINFSSENESSAITSKKEDNEVIDESISSQWLAEIFTPQGHSSSTIEDRDMQLPLSPSSFVEYDHLLGHYYNTEVDFQFNFSDGGELHDIF